METTKNRIGRENKANGQHPTQFNEKFFCFFYPVFILSTPAFLMFPEYEPFEISENTFHFPYSIWESLADGDGAGAAGVFLAIVLVGLLVWAMILPATRFLPGVIAITSIIIFSLVISRAGTLHHFDLSSNGILMLYASMSLTIVSVGHEATLAYQKYRKTPPASENKTAEGT